jgi:protein tyrosine/serine phosphatase
MKPTKRALRYAALSAAIVALISATAIYLHRARPYHLLTVTPGKLYRSGTLKPDHLESVLDRFHIKTVVSLRTEGENALGTWYASEKEICRKKGVDLRELPIDQPPTQEQIDEWLALLEREEKAPILVHCEHGAVRTGVMVAIYQMECLRQENEQTLDDLPVFGHDMDDPVRRPLSDFLRAYVPRWKKAPASRKVPVENNDEETK